MVKLKSQVSSFIAGGESVNVTPVAPVDKKESHAVSWALIFSTYKSIKRYVGTVPHAVTAPFHAILVGPRPLRFKIV